LWKIAKKYYATVDNIKKVNDLTGNDIKEGEMLLIVKESC
jgi:LysM repeat protein